jgi:transposase
LTVVVEYLRKEVNTMTQGKPRDARKEQQWRRWLQDWQASGLSVRAFCARHGLAPPSFYAWRRELQRRDAAQPAFVPVCVVGEDMPACGGVEVVLRGGRTARVGPGFDAATLRQVVALLEEGPPC